MSVWDTGSWDYAEWDSSPSIVTSVTMPRRQRTEQIVETVTFHKFWLLAATVTPRYEPFTKSFTVNATQLVETPYE